MPKLNGWIPFAIQFVVLLTFYYFAGIFGLKFVAVSSLATSIWAPSGIAIAGLLKFGTRLWPAIALAAFSVNFSMGASFISSVLIGVGNTLEGLSAVYLFRKFNPENSINRLRGTLSLILFGALLCPLSSASFGIANLWYQNFISPGEEALTFLTWWLGDAVGILVVTSLLLAWTSPLTSFKDWLWNPRERIIRSVEIFFLVSILILISIYIFQSNSQTFRPYLAFPILIWSAVRFGQRGTTFAIAVLSIVAIWETTLGHGPFVLDGRSMSLLNMQGFIAVVSSSSLILAAVIMERQSILERLKQNARMLEISNTELEQFASVASHDLRGPLRTVSLRIDLLRESLKGKIQPEVEAHMKFILSAVERMQALISMLLDYAHGAKKVIESSLFDSSIEIKQILQLVEAELSEERVKVSIGPLPKIYGDRLLLGQVFQNLISNAIKYRNAENPEVHITSRQTMSDWIFLVKDNGIGFSMKHAEDIFKIFKRLHGSDEISGTGIGLAFCKKIIERHGGKIWVESVETQGSSFYFSIPKRSEYGLNS